MCTFTVLRYSDSGITDTDTDTDSTDTDTDTDAGTDTDADTDTNTDTGTDSTDTDDILTEGTVALQAEVRCTRTTHNTVSADKTCTCWAITMCKPRTNKEFWL